MATIEIKESPVSAALASIPDLLMRASELRNQNDLRQSQENRLQQQFQMQKDQSTLNQSQQLFEMEMQKKQMGMDAAGYDNLELVDYYNSLHLDEGVIEADGGYLNWTGTTVMPTKEEAWTQYKNIATKGGKSITSSDYQLFGSTWAELVNAKNERFKGQIGKLLEQGYGVSDVEQLLAENPIFSQNINNLERYTDAASQKFYAGFQPKKSRGVFGRMSDSPIATSAVLTAAAASPSLAYAGYEALNTTPQEMIDVAKTAYRTRVGDLNTQVKEARAQLESIKNQKRYKGKKGDMRAAKDLLEEAKTNLNKAKKSGSTTFRKMIADENRLNKLKKSKFMPKSPGLLRGMVPGLASSAGGAIGEFVGGDEGAAVGRGLGASAVGMSMSKYVLKRLAQSAPSIAGKVGLAAMADGPALPIGDVIGAIMGMGMSMIEIKNAMSDWQKANR